MDQGDNMMSESDYGGSSLDADGKTCRVWVFCGEKGARYVRGG